MHVISWMYGRMRRGLLGWECQGQPVIYGEDSWHHLGLGLFHRLHFVLPIIVAFSLLKVVSIAVVTIYRQDSWHHLSLCLFIVTIFAISQPAIYAENDHQGLTPFFFLVSIAFAFLITFVLLKVISLVIIVIDRKES